MRPAVLAVAVRDGVLIAIRALVGRGQQGHGDEQEDKREGVLQGRSCGQHSPLSRLLEVATEVAKRGLCRPRFASLFYTADPISHPYAHLIAPAHRYCLFLYKLVLFVAQ